MSVIFSNGGDVIAAACLDVSLLGWSLEETAIDDLVFRWGHAFRETIHYGNAKVARYYLAETKQSNLVLPVSPSLGMPEHKEYRWVSFKQALKMLPSRVIRILEWVGRQLAEAETRGEYAGQF